MFVPFDDGTSIQLWDDDDLCEQEVRRLAPADVKGWQAFCGVKQRLRDALRPEGDGDLWIGRAPSRDELESRLGERRGSAENALRMVDGRVPRAFYRRRASAVGLHGAGGHRHVRQPARPRYGVDSFSPSVRPAGGDARHVGLRRGGNGDGLVHPLRHRARRRRRRRDGRPRSPASSRARASSSREASASNRRASSRTPTRG